MFVAKHIINIGDQFNAWRVIEVCKKKNSKGHSQDYYKCVCTECNKSISMLSASVLKLKKSKQCRWCGFKKRKSYNAKNVGDLSLGLYHRIRQDAKSRNLPFEVSQQFLWNLYCKQLGECALSGLSIEFSKNYKRPRDRTASLDRIDSSRGYFEDNVQWIHKDINLMKMNLNQREFIEICQKIATYQSLDEKTRRYKRSCVLE